MDYRVRIGELQ